MLVGGDGRLGPEARREGRAQDGSAMNARRPRLQPRRNSLQVRGGQQLALSPPAAFFTHRAQSGAAGGALRPAKRLRRRHRGRHAGPEARAPRRRLSAGCEGAARVTRARCLQPVALDSNRQQGRCCVFPRYGKDFPSRRARGPQASFTDLDTGGEILPTDLEVAITYRLPEAVMNGVVAGGGFEPPTFGL